MSEVSSVATDNATEAVSPVSNNATREVANSTASGGVNDVIASIEFIYWVENEMEFPSTAFTLKILRNLSKVDLGLVYVAFRDKLPIPADKLEPLNM